MLRRLDDPAEAAAELVRLANEGGGRDNITVVVVDVVDDGGVARAASAALAGEPSGLESGAPDRSDDDDLAGFTTAMPAVAAAGLARRGRSSRRRTDKPSRAERRAERKRDAPHPVHLARAACSCCSLVAVIGGALATIQWYGTSTYYVTFEDDEVVIYQGRPGGILWVEPELEERTGIDRDDVPARYVRRARGRAASTRRWPRPQAYVANIERDIEELDDGHARPRPPPRPDSTTSTTAGTTTTALGQLMLRAVRRNTELGLILLGTLVTVGAYVLASLAEDATIPANIGAVPRASCSGCSSPPTSPSAASPRTPTAPSCRSPGCSTASATCSSSASTRPRPTRRTWPGCSRRGWRSGIAAFIATLLVVRRVRDLERYRWTIGFLGIGAPAAPARARASGASTSAPGSG